MAMLEFRNGGFKYSGTEKWIFRNLNLIVDPGEMVRVTGRNGSGKSTLLKVISGLLPPSEGHIQIHSEHKIAYMDQFAGEMLALDLTISEQIKAAAAIGTGEQDLSIAKLAEFNLGLQERTDEFIGHLSGGQRQIVALLCTLAAGASIICLDEFSSSMDEPSIEVADRLLTHVNEGFHVTILWISHGNLGLKAEREFEMLSNTKLQ